MTEQAINKLLLKAATVYVQEADEWEKTYGNRSEEFNLDVGSGHFMKESGPNGELEEYTEQEWKYLQVSNEVQKVFKAVTPGLVALGYISATHTITGCAGGSISHYDMDTLVAEKFGDRVQTDSESGCFFCYTDGELAPSVLEYVNEIGGANAGEQWTTYGGDVSDASFSVSADENVSIKGLENWSCGHELLEKLALANPKVI